MRLDVAVSASGEDALGRIVDAAAVAWRGPSRPRRALRLHLDVETGLGRAGLDADRLPSVVARLRASPGVRLAGVWSHLQQADDAPRTARQVDRFATALAGLAEAAGTTRPHHLAASAGLLGRAAPAYDAVRHRPRHVRDRPGRPSGDGLRRRPGDPAPADPVAACPAGPCRRPAERHRDQLRAVVHDVAPEPDRHAPARLWRRLPALTVEPRPGPRPGRPRAARRERGDGRGHGRRDRCARCAGDHRRRVRPRREPGPRTNPDRRAGATAHHQHVGIGHGHVPATAPGVPCRGGTGGGPDHRDVEGF